MGDAKRRVDSRIRKFREFRGLAQEKLAESAGLTGQYLGRVERGQITISLDHLENIAVALGVRLIDLLDCEHEKNYKDLLLEVNAMTNEMTDEQLKTLYRMMRCLVR